MYYADGTNTYEIDDKFVTNSIDNDRNGLIEISILRQLHNMRYNLKGTSYKTNNSDASSTSGCPRGVCRGYELTRSFSTTELESGGGAHYLLNILTQDAVIKSNGYSIADIYLLGVKAKGNLQGKNERLKKLQS